MEKARRRDHKFITEKLLNTDAQQGYELSSLIFMSLGMEV